MYLYVYIPHGEPRRAKLHGSVVHTRGRGCALGEVAEEEEAEERRARGREGRRFSLFPSPARVYVYKCARDLALYLENALSLPLACVRRGMFVYVCVHVRVRASGSGNSQRVGKPTAALFFSPSRLLAWMSVLLVVGVLEPRDERSWKSTQREEVRY